MEAALLWENTVLTTSQIGRILAISLIAGWSLGTLSGQGLTVLHEFANAPSGDRLGSSVAGAGDVDGDGRADIIVGAPVDVTGGFTTGTAIVYSGADGSVIHTFLGLPSGAGFGSAVNGAGDVNADGHHDLIVAATGGGGYVQVFSGIDGSLLYQVAGYVTLTTLGPTDGVAGVGDVNLDGFADFAIGENGFGEFNEGRVRVFSGIDGSVLYEFAGGAPIESFGVAVAGAGDTNGDGYPDIIVGANNPVARDVNNGAYVEVFSGLNGASLYGKLRGGTELGNSVAPAGDINQDGFDDFLAGSTRGFIPTNFAFVRLYSGQTGAELHVFTAPEPFTVFGQSVAGGGDIDGDGVPDVVVGETSPFIGGTTWVYSGFDFTVIAELAGQTDQAFGSDVGMVDDTNGDGRADFVVGAPGANSTIQGIARVYGFAAATDTEPPQVMITQPPPSTVVAIASITVEATIADESDTVVGSVPPGVSANLPAGGGDVSGSLPLLSEGSNLLTVSATDGSGNVGGASVTVVRDSIPPVVDVLSPAEGAVVGTANVNFTIEVTDATATALVFGENTAEFPGGNGTATGDVVLVEGNNSVLVTATDAAGNVTQATRIVVLDLLAPVVSITSPANGACLGPGSEVISVAATVGDLSATSVTSTPPGVAGALPAGGGDVVGPIALIEGSNTITVGATDATSRVGSASINVILDTTPPTVAFSSPFTNQSVSGTIDVTIDASDMPGSGIVQVDIEVDGSPHTTLATEPFEILFDTQPLADGLHTLRAIATDAKGNAASAEVGILVDNMPPGVTITTPADNSLVSGSIPFAAAVDDSGSGLVEVTMSAGGQPPTVDGSATFSPPLVGAISASSVLDTTLLLDGPLDLSVHTRDAAGNVRAEAISVTIDNTQPEKTLLAPADGSVVSGTLSIEAAASDPHLAELEIEVDGAVVATSSHSPLILPFDTTSRFDGEMVVRAIVRDLADNEASCFATVTVDNLAFELVPRTLSLKSKGKGNSITATIEGPNVAMLADLSGVDVELRVPGGSPVLTTTASPVIGDSDGDGVPEAKLKFDRQELIGAVWAGIAGGAITGDSVEVTLFATPVGATPQAQGSVTVKLVGAN